MRTSNIGYCPGNAGVERYEGGKIMMMMMMKKRKKEEGGGGSSKEGR